MSVISHYFMKSLYSYAKSVMGLSVPLRALHSGTSTATRIPQIFNNSSSRIWFGFLHPGVSHRCYCVGFDESAGPQKKKKKVPEVRINLFSQKKEMSVVSMEDGEKLAKRRGLTLSKIQNPPKYMTVGDREAYELLDSSRIQGQSVDKKIKELGFKGLKQMQMSSKIADHDFNIKLNKVNKWLRSGYVSEILVVCPTNDLDVPSFMQRLESKLPQAELPGTIKSKSKVSLRIHYEPSKDTTDNVTLKFETNN